MNVDEVVSHVLQYISGKDYGAAAKVSKFWYQCSCSPQSMNRQVFLHNQIHQTRVHLLKVIAELSFECRDPWLTSTSRFIEALTEQHHDEQLSRVRSAMGAESQGIWAALMSHPMSFDEKRKLSMAIHNLPRTKLGRVIEILERCRHTERHGTHSGASASSSSAAHASPLAPSISCTTLPVTPQHVREHTKTHECIEVDLDQIDTRTMRELELYVRNVAAQTQKKKAYQNTEESPDAPCSQFICLRNIVWRFK
mmetsp:Transcript_24824/g.44985  ORF Transcript_24824/g.44985 Transcript_24824/m.44985 type:complete len:253 (+) Transcript_24824:40-798(+)